MRASATPSGHDPERRRLLAWAGAAMASAGLGCSEAARKDVVVADPVDTLDPRGRAPDKLRIGITPSSGSATGELVRPLADYLSRELELVTATRTGSDYDAVAAMLGAGELDVAILSPLTYVRARASLPAVALATATRGGSPTYLGYLVVRDHGPEHLEALRGATVAWVHRSSASGYLYPRALLRKKGLDPDKVFGRALFTGNHEDAVRAIGDGTADVAAVAAPFIDPGPLNPFDGGDEGSETASLRVLAKTDRIPLDCVVVRNDVGRELARRLRSALLSLVEDKSASQALQHSWGMNGFVRPEQRYEGVEAVLREGV
jgi:phosphonate transport system substrate-binding protein